MILDNVAFIGNTGTNGGGAYVSSSSPVLSNVLVANNLANEGGGLYINSGNPLIENLLIVGNEASGRGGGLYMDNSHPEVVNAVIADNQANLGGGLVVEDSGPSLSGVIVQGNTATAGGGIYVIGGNTVAMSFCDSYGNTPNDYQGMADPTGVDGNLDVDPLFMDQTAADPLQWNFHLSPYSPLVDAGLFGTLDPDGTRADMGAYGGTEADSWDMDWDGYPEWWLPGPYDPLTSPGLDCHDQDATLYPGSGC